MIFDFQKTSNLQPKTSIPWAKSEKRHEKLCRFFPWLFPSFPVPALFLPHILSCGGLPTGYQLLKAIRVEDSAMFRRYSERRERIKQRRETCEPLEPGTLTRQVGQH